MYRRFNLIPAAFQSNIPVWSSQVKSQDERWRRKIQAVSDRTGRRSVGRTLIDGSTIWLRSWERDGCGWRRAALFDEP